MQMNIPATFGPICFSGSLEEDWNGKNIQELKTQANFRVWEIWKSLFHRAVAIKKELWL
jgi:hypothetical protein